MPARTDAPEKEAKKKGTPAPVSKDAGKKVQKTPVRQKFEKLMEEAKVEASVAEIAEKQLEDGGKKIATCFVTFNEGQGKEAIKELLWSHVTTDVSKGYQMEVDREEEVVLFYKV